MPRLPAAEPNHFSRSIAAAIEAARDRAGITTPTLIMRSGLSGNYYYKRARGEASFSTNDIEIFSAAIGISHKDLLEIALNIEDEGALASEEQTLSASSLAVRIQRLVADARAHDANLDVEAAVLAAVSARTTRLPPDAWDGLIRGDDVAVTDEQLAAISTYFKAHPDYLRKEAMTDLTDGFDARLEISLALAETGALNYATRSLSAASPATLRSIAKAIRDAAQLHQ